MTLSRAALELLIRAATSTPVLVVVVDMPWLDQEALPDGTIAPTGKAFAATPMPQVGAARCCTCIRREIPHARR